MADPYNSVKAGRLTFKGGSVATLSKSIDKKKKKNKFKKKESSFSEQIINNNNNNTQEEVEDDGPVVVEAENVYTIDAAKKMSYYDLFPVEAKKFGYEAKDGKEKAKAKAESSVEGALDDRVKKKADRYCK